MVIVGDYTVAAPEYALCGLRVLHFLAGMFKLISAYQAYIQAQLAPPSVNN